MRRVHAKYNRAILPEHRGNPLIEALPPKASPDSVMDEFCYYPDLDPHIRQHPDPLVREEYTSRLKNLRQPLPIYYECFRAIETAIKQGYSTKNPFSPSTSQFLHYPVDERPDVEPVSGYFKPKGEGITLVGESGVGKTSMLEQVLNYFPTVIIHDVYKGKKMEHRSQVVWLKVDCPNNSSVRDLCEEILAHLDEACGFLDSKPAQTIGGLKRQIEQRVKSSFLGILVIDEMQRLQIRRAKGENNLLNFLHSLVNKLGVPILFCANPPFDITLSKTLKAARRAESGGYLVMTSPTRNSQSWKNFVEELWDLHWTNISTELTPELSDKLHELSTGNLDLAHRIYRNAQKLVIGTEDERITEAVLEHSYNTACALSARTEEIREAQATYIPRRSVDSSKEKAVYEKNHTNIPGDLSRPQHPEFSNMLSLLQRTPDLLTSIGNPDLLRSASEEADPIKILETNGILCEDPLSRFA